MPHFVVIGTELFLTCGVLREVDLPLADIPLALLFFNVGVEVGQRLFIVVGVLRLSAIRACCAGRVIPGTDRGTPRQ